MAEFPSEVIAATAWPDNSAMILAVRQLGFISDEDLTLDASYGQGGFWRRWAPMQLVTNDLDPETNALYHDDFRKVHFADGTFDVVVLDGPYKLNGTASGPMDERYGVHVPATWQERMQLIRDGMTECVRVLRVGGRLLLKCQNQVSSGAVRWQVDDFTSHGETLGLKKTDQLEYLGKGRPQPEGTRQIHARHTHSSLLIFTKKRR